jgi:hypothetical protein
MTNLACRETAPEMPLARAERPAPRRHLTDAQKAQLGRKIEPDIAERARLRQEATRFGGGDQLITTGKTREEVAKAVGDRYALAAHASASLR